MPNNKAQRTFQSTLPLRGATNAPTEAPPTASTFQSTLPLRGATRRHHRSRLRRKHFNPHSPCGERPSAWRISPANCNFNPHSPCGERLLNIDMMVIGSLISIHTPLAGSDENIRETGNNRKDFNPHSPCGERRQKPHRYQSHGYFNPHSPCGERPRGWKLVKPMTRFQSTLPLRGATHINRVSVAANLFQSTLPLRGATAEMRHF